MALTKRQPALPDFILAVRDEIDRLCRAHHVTRLELFGSATGADFNTDSSDVDFLVEWDHGSIGHVLDNYFGFQDALAELLGRRVDLVAYSRIESPYMKRSVD